MGFFFEYIVKKTFDFNCVEETEQFAEVLGEVLLPGDIVCLEGDLGAGKTTFTRGVARGLAVQEDQYVTSPSFAIMHQYDGKYPLYHFDFYRLGMADEIIDLGFEELFYGQGVCVIEWPERAAELLPQSCLKIHLLIVDEYQRKAEAHYFDTSWDEKLKNISSRWRS